MKLANKSKGIERRGRKAGDGVLQNIDPHSSDFEKRMMLTFGRTHRDGVSAMVRWIRNLPSMIRYFGECRKTIGEQAVQDTEHIQIPENDQGLIAEVMSGSGFKTIDGKRVSVKALRYWFERRQFEKNTNEIRETLHSELDEALTGADSEWFQNIADAIESEKDAEKYPVRLYPLHNALLSIIGVQNIPRSAVIYPEGSIAGASKKPTPQLTITELCVILEKQGFRVKTPNGQSDADWQRTVRRACDEIGFPFLAGKPGRKRKE